MVHEHEELDRIDLRNISLVLERNVAITLLVSKVRTVMIANKGIYLTAPSSISPVVVSG